MQEQADDGDGTVRRFRKGRARTPKSRRRQRAAADFAIAPDWLTRDAAPEPRADRHHALDRAPR